MYDFRFGLFEFSEQCNSCGKCLFHAVSLKKMAHCVETEVETDSGDLKQHYTVFWPLGGRIAQQVAGLVQPSKWNCVFVCLMNSGPCFRSFGSPLNRVRNQVWLFWLAAR